MGHRKLAAIETVVVAFFWAALFLPDPEYPMTAIGAVVAAAILVVFLHVPDAVGTWFLARRGLFPEKEGRPAAGVGAPVEGREPAAHTR